jgi:hypothetical protein
MMCAPFIKVCFPCAAKKTSLQIVVPELMHVREMKLFCRQSIVLDVETRSVARAAKTASL